MPLAGQFLSCPASG